MIKAHQLIEAIRARRYGVAVDADNMASHHEKLLMVADIIEHSQKFDLTRYRPDYPTVRDAGKYGLAILESGDNPFPFQYLYADLPEYGEAGQALAALVVVQDKKFTVIPFRRNAAHKWFDYGFAIETFDNRCFIRVAVGLLPVLMDHFIGDEDRRNSFSELVTHLLGVFTLLSAGRLNSAVEVPSQSANRKRIAAGELPLFEHHVVLLPKARHISEPLGGTHASPRLHWRRGHIRQLGDGQEVHVKPHLVGDIMRGFVSHDYTIKQ